MKAFNLPADGPSTLMGQFMEALNNQTVLDDLGLNIDTFQGELPNVDEVSGKSIHILAAS